MVRSSHGCGPDVMTAGHRGESLFSSKSKRRLRGTQRPSIRVSDLHHGPEPAQAPRRALCTVLAVVPVQSIIPDEPPSSILRMSR